MFYSPKFPYFYFQTELSLSYTNPCLHGLISSIYIYIYSSTKFQQTLDTHKHRIYNVDTRPNTKLYIALNGQRHEQLRLSNFRDDPSLLQDHQKELHS